MAVSYSSITLNSLLYPQYRPPPLLPPKPGKDNVRLQKLLKKSAKKKAAPTITHVPAPFRISLSPVNEASADLEHSDHSTPPRTPETPYYFYGGGGTQPSQAPRFTVRPLYQHVQSPYPQRAGFNRFSPVPVPAPSSAFIPQHATPLSCHVQQSYVIGVPSFPGSARSTTPVPEVTVTRPPVMVTIVAPTPASQMAPRSPLTVTIVAPTPASQMPPRSPLPRPFIASGDETFLRPLTVLVPLGKPKSPRPTFIATETSRSPKPMFDVPQIRIYTANTSYYEPSMTPPVYDMTGLTSIGSTVPRSKTPTSEVRRAITPMPEVQIVITTSEVNRGATPTGLTPSSATDPRSRTPTSEVKRSTTPTPEANRSVTPTSGNKRALTVISDVKRAKSPSYDYGRARTPTGRPRTPSYGGTRAATPMFEVSRPNPLLFAVSLVVLVEKEQPTASTPVPAHASLSTSQSVKSTEAQITETPFNSKITVNGDIHLDVAPVESTPGRISKPESAQQLAQVTDFTKTPPLPVPYPPPKTPTNVTPKPAVVVPPPTPAVVVPTAYQSAVVVPTGYQRPKTPTKATPKPAVGVPPGGYHRPRTPYYGPSGPSPVAFQRPKTPTSGALRSKSAYRGLTPAEYVAFGGIQSFTPAFGISRARTPTQEEDETEKEISEDLVKPTQPVKTHSLVEVFTMEDIMEDIAVDHTPAPVIPTIVVSEASDVPKTAGPVTSHVAKTPEKLTMLQEMTCPTAENVDVKPPEKERTTTPTQQVPKPKIPEAKQPVITPVSISDIKVPLMVKPIVKDTAKTTESVAKTETQTTASQQKESVKPTFVTSAKADESTPITPTLPAEGSTPVQALAKSTVNEDKVKDEKDASAVPSPVKKEGDDSPLAVEPLLKALLKPNGAKSKLSGWGRLKKHMVVEQEEPKFPEAEPQKEPTGHVQSEGQKDQKEERKPSDKSATEDDETQSETQSADGAKAPQMWEAVLFGMFSSKEKIMRQIELSKDEGDRKSERPAEKPDKAKDTDIPTFAHRLPVLLFSPRFDAKRLREAASRPVTKISTVFEMALIGRKNKEEEPKDFNRAARGFFLTT